jgi:2'-5' RNA ligase
MKTADESWRLFIAIELPGTLRELVLDHINRLRQAGPEARASWARAENLHLTLKFLGDTHVSRVDVLATAVRHAASQTSPFQAQVQGCGAFPLRGQPRVLWIGVDDPTGGLTKLYRALEDECAQAGFSREERSFHPHLTVARLRQPQGARHLAEVHRQMGFQPTSFRVSELCLIRSELMSAGSRYTVIARHALKSE